MWTNGRQTKTNSKTSPEQSGELKSVKTAPPPGGNFHDDWAKNVTSRVFTSFFYYINIKKLPPGSHETNVLTKFHENWAKNVTYRVFTCFQYIHIEKNASPTGGHVFHRSGPFSNSSEISIKSMFSNIVTSSVFTRKTAPPTGGHVFQRTRTTFEHNHHITKTNILTNFQILRYIIGTNLLTKFHEDRTKNVASRVFSRKTAPPTGGHNFQHTRTTFKLNQHIIKTNIVTNFEHDRDIIWTKLLTKFHEDRKRNVPSRVFTNKCLRTDDGQRPVTKAHLRDHVSSKKTIEPRITINTYMIHTTTLENAPPPLQPFLTKFHENWAQNVTSRVFTCFHYIHMEKNEPPTGGNVFSPIWTIFELVREINKTNVLANFYDDWANIVTSRVFTRFLYSQIKETAPPTGSNFELDRDFIWTKLLTKFHEDRTINVASRVFTN
ncbi:hypothetical protein DPMN_186466 [Dreissena polymorpha]|uniref:Uncharacterized protein n=1 Tax=Dreissena polymorpha TaxID=45954 RepID=A0A9D4DQF8_DREPO|nr:hypothetical protein DPMN_186466 [Dreissena polymorpha]